MSIRQLAESCPVAETLPGFGRALLTSWPHRTFQRYPLHFFPPLDCAPHLVQRHDIDCKASVESFIRREYHPLSIRLGHVPHSVREQ